MILLVIATVAFSLLLLAWVLYPAVMRLRAGSPRTAAVNAGQATEGVAVIVATRDHPAYALARVQNLRASRYPASLLRIFVGVDANSPHPIDAYRQALAGVADVVSGDAGGGKAVTLNAAVRAARGADVLVFADIAQEFNPEAIAILVAALRDGTHGAATGRYTHSRSDGIMSAYADLETVIRAGQSAGRSVVSATGAILALKPSLWKEMPAGLICDDLFTGLSVVRQESRVVFCPDAIAWDPRTFTRDQQFSRRVRTLTGLIQYCLISPGALFPWSNPVWGHFVLHKILRLLTPLLFAVGAFALAGWLAVRQPLLMLGSIAVALGVAEAVYLVSPATFRRLRDQVVWAFRLMLVPVLAIANGLRGRWSVWTPTSQVRANIHPGA
jgi:cellulose synthase/poly-beta-1,6-N-acetylglucosamine synthase-like glycosyltransferase